jgi:type IV secretory pathway TrbF-like protein
MESMAKNWGASRELETPYRRASQEWDSRLGSAVVQAYSWRMATILSLAVLAFAVAGLIYLGAQPKRVPHIIEVDALGAATYRGAVGRSVADYKPSEASLRYFLREFVECTRSVSSDQQVVRQCWLKAYAYVTQAGAGRLTTEVQRRDPLKRALEERVTVEILAVVPVSGSTWQVDWRERQFSRAGQEVGTELWRGMFPTVLRASDREEDLAKNPLGLYIEDFHWDRISQ